MDINIIAQEILRNVGGKENVSKNMICVSRLRLVLKDESKVNLEAIKAMEGVLGIIEAETLQIILGTANVRRIGTDFSLLTGIPLETVQIVCHPGEPCDYHGSEMENTKGFFSKLLGAFKK